MILADTSVWIGHLRSGDAQLERHLLSSEIVCHPLIIAEIALGSLKDRATVLGLLDGLAPGPVAETGEIRQMIEVRRLYARGIGFVDAALLASCLLAPGMRLWTRDKRLDAVAIDLELAYGAQS